MENKITIKGARQHNLKNINLQIPKNKLVVFTGVSGSGKSSIAFDTIYAEGQRRYVESLSAYARQFLGLMDRPDVDSIEGLSPAISISQKSVSHNPRSTVGTITEIYDYLRLLFARIGHPHCPQCCREIVQQDLDQIVDRMEMVITQELKKSARAPTRWLILSPVVRNRKGEFSRMFKDLRAKGYNSLRIDKIIYSLEKDLYLLKNNRHTIEVVIDRLTFDTKILKQTKQGLMEHRTAALKRRSPTSSRGKSGSWERLTEAVEQALELSDGLVIISQVKDSAFNFPDKPKKLDDHLFSQQFTCPDCNINIEEIEPRLFSFNTPHGACSTCNGLGNILKVDPQLVLNENLSITEGAITPLVRHFTQDTWLARLILTVCGENKIPIKEPLSKLTNNQRKILLYGTDKRTYFVEGENRFGRLTTITEKFKGVIHILQNRYQETQSEYMRGQIEKYMRQETCSFCSGSRLKPEALSITIDEKNISDICKMSIKEAKKWVFQLKLSSREQAIAELVLKELRTRLSFLVSVGLDYLTLSREARTLAGGEGQRIMLASQIGSGLTGVLYVLDEPSIGLHPRDNNRLIKTLKNLRNLGNAVIVVEHDRETIENADYIVDFGPGGGKHGGKIVGEGTVDEIKKNKQSLTGDYLAGRKKIQNPNSKFQTTFRKESKLLITNYQLPKQQVIKIIGCSQFNLKNIHIEFPLGNLICVTGVSGSGKSTLIVETLYKALKLNFNPYYKEIPGKYIDLTGAGQIKSVQLIDQSPIGRTPRSNSATYTKAFDCIRELFARTEYARLRGFTKSRFSFNIKGGRCAACEGQGENKIEMQFLADVYVKCEVCLGKRYNRETLEVSFKDKNIAEVLKMTLEEATDFFRNIPGLATKLQTLTDVGLSYIELGQPAPSLSGGEAQRVKLAAELAKHGKGKTLFILDEPTTGLHFHDLSKLLTVLRELVRRGNTVIVIEHNLDVIKSADWIIDLGPEGGERGGEVLGVGTPYELAKIERSYTGRFLAKVLA